MEPVIFDPRDERRTIVAALHDLQNGTPEIDARLIGHLASMRPIAQQPISSESGR